MLRSFDKNGNVRNVFLNEDGSIPVSLGQGGNGVSIQQTSDREVVISASVLVVSTQIQSMDIGKKVTQISIANYSDNADISMVVDGKTYQIGSCLAVDFPINKNVDRITLASTEDSTKVQLIIKGVE